MFLSFSGGGSRASAFSYGVLEQLAATRYRSSPEHRLIDEIDMISSVSGGSVTAAYYGLYLDGLFENFKEKFLLKDIEAELTSSTLSISNLVKLSSETYGTGDLVDSYFDQLLYSGATLDQLLDNQGPIVQINATDLFKGGRFGFSKEQFSIICSDPKEFPVARAVAASSAVPLIFTPITLSNRSGSCGYQTPAWIEQSIMSDHENLRRKQRARYLKQYNDIETHPYIHLLDGGLSDNLGLRSVIDFVVEQDGIWNALKSINQQNARFIVIIVVNAASAVPTKWDKSKSNPPSAAVLDAATTIPLMNYNFETLEYVRSNIQQWQRDLNEAQCRGRRHCDPSRFYLIEVSIDEIKDQLLRQKLTAVETGFKLEAGVADELINAAREVLQNHPQFVRLKQDMNLQ